MTENNGRTTTFSKPPPMSSATVTESRSPLIDAAGVHHQPAGREARIVSLVPSITELLFDLGLGAQVVGRTVFCVHPKDRVRMAKSIGGTKQVNVEKLRRLEPSHVIVNVDETPRPLADDLARIGYTVVVTHPIDVEDNLSLYRLMGSLFDREVEAEALCARFNAAFNEVTALSHHLAERRALYLIWKHPWMTVSRDTYISRMLARVKWMTVADDPKVRYPVIDVTDELIADVDLLLFSTEPFPFKDKHLDEFWAAFPAYAGKALIVDAEMTSWYGSRAILGLRYLAQLAQSQQAW